MVGWLGELQVSHSLLKLLSGEFQGKGKGGWPAFALLFHLKMPLVSHAGRESSVGSSWPPTSSVAGEGNLDVLVNILKTENKSIHLCKKCCPQEKFLIISKAKCTGTNEFTTNIDYFIINCSLAFLHLLLNRNETLATENNSS